ncbi:two-CW domain-containing protein [Candidatus Zixiibacteriota bacterium]
MKESPTRQDTGTPNCWEFTNCGREPGGNRADDLGVCPAAADGRFDGLNDGVNAGRVCWAVAGTCSHDQPQCILADRARPCDTCEFYKYVHSSTEAIAEAEFAERQLAPLCRESYYLTA